MKRFRGIALALVALGVVALEGCVALSQNHPTTETRYASPTEQAFWVERRWRQDKADEWALVLERQSAARMSREFGN